MSVPPRVLLGVFTTSLCFLMLELTLTRLFSATMFYHFAFAAISLALFGAAASGVLIYVFRDRVRGLPPLRLLSAEAALFALGAVLALLVVLRSPLSPFAMEPERLVRIYLASAVPFFFGGAVITLAISRWAPEANRLYSFDLAGAAAGCLLLIPALDLLGGVNTVLLVATLAALAGVIFEARPALVVLAAGLAALLVGNLGAGWIDVRRAKGYEESDVLFAKWNSFSRVTVSGDLADPLLHIRIDADASTLIRRAASETELHGDLKGAIESVGYHLFRGGTALVIGPGEGEDIVRARLFGARRIVAVELNPIIARDVMSREPFRLYAGALFEQPGVELVVDDARSFIRRSPERFDLIQATMVDTWAATAAGAFALSESNLYTVEAFREYLDHLSDRGILTFTRWYEEPPVQLLRLVALARAALAGRGIAEPARCFLIVRRSLADALERRPGTLVFKKDGITEQDLRGIEAVASRQGFDLVYSPFFFQTARLGNLATRAPDLVAWAWGVNGAASVMGSVGAVALALVSGFDVVLLVGASLYVLALLCVRGRPA